MINSYVGIPYVDKGRTLVGCDCWGLVRIIHLEQAGIEIPSYGDISEKDLLRVAREIRAGLEDGEMWIDVAALPRREMDVVVMKKLDRADRFPYHVGLMVSGTRMVHTVQATGSHTVPLDHPSVRTGIISFRRHRDLA